MNTSPAGRKLIEAYEGLELTAYPDPATGGDPWTVGFGDTGPDVVPGLTITREEASRRLTDRLKREFEPGVIKAVGGAWTSQNQFDAMVSLAYNIGVWAFAWSSIARHHTAGEYTVAADAFLLWNQAGGRVLAGLTRRRAEERKLYLSGAAEPAKPDPFARDIVSAVTALQIALNAAGAKLSIDGQMGPRTIKAYEAITR